MLMILALCLLLGSVFVFCVKRSRESLLLTALCLSLDVYKRQPVLLPGQEQL